MTSEPMPIPADTLLSHSGSIRALALSILGDEHAAEDVLQETWMRAIERPPPRHDSIGGWLRRVAEGIAISRLRSEGRRRHRETLWVGEQDCTHSAYDGEERAEVLRSVVDEVLALDEPYKETVLRRYFEGLKPSEISAATNTSVATVNSRLQRAQARLRERLDRRLSDRCGGMRGALLALVGWPEEAAAGVAAGWGASLALKVALAAVAIAGVVALATIVVREREPAPQVVTGAPLAEPNRVVPLATAGNEQREPLAAVSADAERERALAFPAPAPAPFAYELAIEPLDGLGRPLAGCEIWLAADPGLPALVGTTGWDGALRLAWRGDEPRATLVVRASRIGRGSTVLRRVQIASGAPQLVQLALEQGPAFDAAVRTGGATGSGPSAADPRNRPPRPVSRFALDAAGNGVFFDPWLLETGAAFAADALSAVLPDPPMRASSDAGATPAATLEIQALDADGRPLAGAQVSACFASGVPRLEVQADERGIATFAVAAGALAVYVSAPTRAHPLARARLDLAAGERRTVSLALAREPLARVRLVKAARPDHGLWVYELRDQAGSTVGRGSFDAEGRAAISLPGGGPCALLAREGREGPAVVIAAALFAQDREQDLAAPPEPRTRSLVVQVEGARADDATVRVERVDSGDALEAPPAGPGSFAARGLPVGDYRVIVGAPARGWIDAGVVHLAAGRGPERLLVRLDEPAQLEIPRGDPSLTRIEVLRGGMRLASPDVAIEGGAILRVAPGRVDRLRASRNQPFSRAALELDPGR